MADPIYAPVDQTFEGDDLVLAGKAVPVDARANIDVTDAQVEADIFGEGIGEE